jgi:colanic acid biosynthesis glycosyl transferase WcaI
VPKILSLYHYYRPDDVAGARHFTDFCEGLVERGYQVDTWPCNRSCHHYDAVYNLKREVINGVTVDRVWRPPLKQHSFLGRIIDALWVMAVWCLRFLTLGSGRPDILVIGTDPIFSLLIVPFFKLLHPKVKVVHWCFDVYPEYAIADGIVKENSLISKILRGKMKKAYAACDLVADIGPCMREKLEHYPAKARSTHSPWALEEPGQFMSIDADERKELFGETPLALLYSGNLGRPHEFYLILKLARFLRDSAIFTYSARGSRLDELKLAINPEDKNVRLASFVPPEKLAIRLSAPDIHLVSLRPEWTGMVVPSKFFGALAIGRPVLFEGDPASSIARWILEYKVGWVLQEDNLDKVKEELLKFSKSKAQKAEMFRHCHEVYRAHFSKKAVLDEWHSDFQKLLSLSRF